MHCAIELYKGCEQVALEKHMTWFYWQARFKDRSKEA